MSWQALSMSEKYFFVLWAPSLDVTIQMVNDSEMFFCQATKMSGTDRHFSQPHISFHIHILFTVQSHFIFEILHTVLQGDVSLTTSSFRNLNPNQ